MLVEKCVILVFLVCIVDSEARANPLVKTDIGVIKGLRADDGDYSMFLGIPFAQVNVSNPFGAAAPHPGFKNTFEAYNDSMMCPQRNEFTNKLTGSLDCLVLNIYVPFFASSESQLPVLVYLYGGSFQEGSHNRNYYGASYLVKHEVIFVTINYRGGPYGFMCLDIPEVPGNQGFKDQVLGLRWLKKHIRAFGGDPNKITLSGGSAGSVAVDAHLHSNNEKLFEQVILHSGTMMIPLMPEPLRRAPTLLADYLGFTTNSLIEALQFLSKEDPLLVTNAAENLGIIDNFKVCIEKKFNGVESFITENWITASLPKIKNMTVLIGFNNDEMCAYHTSKDDEYYQNTFENILSFGFDVTAKEFKGMEDIVRNFYFGDEPISALVKRNLCDFDSDFKFIYPTCRTIEKYLQNEAGSIFVYLFSYVGGRNFVRDWWNVIDDGTVHGDELGYLFDMLFYKGLPMSREDQQIVNQLTKIWTNFVKFGNPIPQPSELLPVKWIPVTERSQLPYLNIGTKLTLEARPFHRRTAFWDLFYKTNNHLQIVYSSAKVTLSPGVNIQVINDRSEL